MPDIRILLFIGFIVYQLIVFLSKLKAKNEAKKANSAPVTTNSLEEILERMNPQNNPQKTTQTSSKKQPTILYSEVEEERPENVQKKFKNIKSIEQGIGSTVNYEKTSPIFSSEDKKPFNEYATQTQNTNRYVKKIKDPQSFRDAFVINEILNPKYIK